MGQLAVAAVGLTPLVEQGQDLSGFLIEQPMYGRSAWAPVDQLPQGAAGSPKLRRKRMKLSSPTSWPPRIRTPCRASKACNSSTSSGAKASTRTPLTEAPSGLSSVISLMASSPD